MAKSLEELLDGALKTRCENNINEGLCEGDLEIGVGDDLSETF